MQSLSPDPAARVMLALDRMAGDLPALGVAFSGGGDSTALLHMVHDWARGRRIMVATVDHGLRAESAAEAQAAHRTAQALGLNHVILQWRRDLAEGNLMAGARDARLRLIAAWAKRNELPAVALGHTRDDQAETLLMRLMRGAGVDGLAAMREEREAFGLRWLRPMLEVGRLELRDWLSARGIGWIDDPTNDDPAYDRVRVRQVMDAMGMNPATLALSARHIAAARDALAHFAAAATEDVTAERGTLVLPRGPFRRSPPEVQRRLAVAAARWITGAEYPPRRATVTHALAGLAAGNRVTLEGALFEPTGDRIRVIREPAAAMRAPASEGPVWDDRWHVEGLRPGHRIAALGLDRLGLVNWRASSLSRDEAAATPAILDGTLGGGRLVAAPVLRRQAPFTVRPLRDRDDFTRLIRAQ